MKRHVVVAVTFLIVTTLGPRVHAYIATDVAGPDDPQYGMIQLGMGVNLATGQPTSKVVTGVQETVPFIEEQCSLYLVETKEELAKAMGLSVNAQANAAAWSAGVKASWYQGFTRSSNSVTLYVSMKLTSAIDRYKDAPTLSPDVLRGSMDDFVKRAGTHYISAVVKGGELCALLRIDDVSETAKQELGVALSGRYAIYSASAQLTSSLESLKETKKVHLQFKAKGAEVPIPELTVAGLISACNLFEKAVRQNPGSAYPMWAEASDYVLTETEKRQLETMQYWSEQWDKYSVISQRLANIAEHPDAFDNVDLVALVAARDCVDGEILPQIMAFLRDRPGNPTLQPPRVVCNYSWPAPKELAFVTQRIAQLELKRLARPLLPDNLVVAGASADDLVALADFYEMLAGLYESRQFLYAQMFVGQPDPNSIYMDPYEAKSWEDAYKAALCLGISYYLRPADRKEELRAKGYAELSFAKALEEQPLMLFPDERSPILKNIVGGNKWPRGIDGDLVLGQGSGPWILRAGMIMDFDRISVAEGCRLSIVADTSNYPSESVIAPSKKYVRNANWHYSEFASSTTNTTDRYFITNTRTFEESLGESEGVGAISLLGCRTDCTIDGTIEYKGMLHDGDETWSLLVPFPSGNQLISYKIEQALGGAGGNSNGYSRDGGSGASGYGGGGAGGGAAAGSGNPDDGAFIAYGGTGGSGGSKGGDGESKSNAEHGVDPTGKSPSDFSRWGNGGGGRSEAWWKPHEHAYGGAGGNGGMKGLHGGALCLKVWGSVMGSGLIDVSGSDGLDGETGANGGGQAQPGGYAMGGGGGGGGAGGSGGSIWLFYGTSLSSDLKLTASAGAPGLGKPGGQPWPDPTQSWWAGDPGTNGTEGADGQVNKGAAK